MLSHALKIRTLPKTTSKQFTAAVIGNGAHCSSKTEFDGALTEERPVIVIKDSKLGNRIVLWIGVGRCLEHMTLATALGSVVCSADVHRSILRYGKPLAVCSFLMLVGYKILWSKSPLMHYRVAQGNSMCAAIRGLYNPTTILAKEEHPKTCFFSTVACAFAVVTAFWNDVTSYNYKEAFNKLTDLPQKVAEEMSDEK